MGIPIRTDPKGEITTENGNTVVLPAGKHKFTIILLHGRGDTGPKFAAEFLERQDENKQYPAQRLPKVKWVFPTAPYSIVDRTGDEVHQWFDM